MVARIETKLDAYIVIFCIYNEYSKAFDIPTIKEGLVKSVIWGLDGKTISSVLEYLFVRTTEDAFFWMLF